MILDMEEESSSWKIRTDELTDKLLQCFWKDNKFVAMKAKTGEIIEKKYLLLYMPIILGDRLPKDVWDKLLSNLFKENNF